MQRKLGYRHGLRFHSSAWLKASHFPLCFAGVERDFLAGCWLAMHLVRLLAMICASIDFDRMGGRTCVVKGVEACLNIRKGGAMQEESSKGLGTLPTEARRAGAVGFDGLTALGMVRAMHAADVEALIAVEAALPQAAAVVEAVAERLAKNKWVADNRLVEGGRAGGGRLFYVGAGTSGRLGVLDASECPPTFHTPPEMVQGLIAGGERALRQAVEGAEDDAEQGAEMVRACGVCTRDVVVGIAASGRTPFVLGAMVAAREAGALTVGMSCVPGSPVEQAGELAVTAATGAEVITGSTRLKAGTATKLMLNMISTAVMARLGYVHGSLMVNVQPTNAKLRDRAVRIVAELCELGRGEAEAALAHAGGEVKTAVVMAHAGVGVEEARGRLEQAGGILRKALEG